MATKLLRWFIDYEPSDALVADVAEVFRQSGGDIKTVVKRVLAFENVRWAPPLFKRPFHYIVSGLRAMNANMTRYDTLRFTWLAGMGQVPFNWDPPNGYPQSFEYRGTLVLPRWNFAFSLGIPGSVGGATIDTTALLVGRGDGAEDCRPHGPADLRRGDAGRGQGGARHVPETRSPQHDEDPRRLRARARVARLPVVLRTS